MDTKRIVLNRIRTPDGTILTSHHVHDYQTYKDENGLVYSVDGGSEYLRRNVHEEAPYEELSVYEDDDWELIRASFHRGGRGKDGKQPLKWVPMNEMSNNWLENCIIYNNERNLGNSFANELYSKELEYRKENNIFIDE